MNNITEKCAGCDRLLNFHPTCAICINQKYYVPRCKDSLGIDKEVTLINDCLAMDEDEYKALTKKLKEIVNTRYGTGIYRNESKEEKVMYDQMFRSKPKTPAIEKVIFNEPATIVLWNDHTKTVVKCQEGDTFDPEKGLAMAITKKFFGNKGNYCEVFKEWIPEEEEEDLGGPSEGIDIAGLAERLNSNASKAIKIVCGTCDTCKYKDLMGYKWPCVNCNSGSKWKTKGE